MTLQYEKTVRAKLWHKNAICCILGQYYAIMDEYEL